MAASTSWLKTAPNRLVQASKDTGLSARYQCLAYVIMQKHPSEMLTYEEIAREVDADPELYTWTRSWLTGATPANSYCSAISKDMRDNNPNSHFVKLDKDSKNKRAKTVYGLKAFHPHLAEGPSPGKEYHGTKLLSAAKIKAADFSLAANATSRTPSLKRRKTISVLVDSYDMHKAAKAARVSPATNRQHSTRLRVAAERIEVEEAPLRMLADVASEEYDKEHNVPCDPISTSAPAPTFASTSTSDPDPTSSPALAPVPLSPPAQTLSANPPAVHPTPEEEPSTSPIPAAAPATPAASAAPAAVTPLPTVWPQISLLPSLLAMPKYQIMFPSMTFPTFASLSPAMPPPTPFGDHYQRLASANTSKVPSAFYPLHPARAAPLAADPAAAPTEPPPPPLHITLSLPR